MIKYDIEALEYISKLSEGGLRDAITLLDKCIAYSKEVTLENVVKTLGTVNYQTMIDLTDAMVTFEGNKKAIEIIESIHNAGKDLKQFVKQYIHFLLDVQKYSIGCDWNQLDIPKLNTYEEWLKNIEPDNFDYYRNLLRKLIRFSSDIKYSATVKLDVEAFFLLAYEGE